MLLLLSSCGGPEAKKHSPAPGRAPGEGLIVYSDPVPPSGSRNPRRRNFQPEIQAFTTAEKDLVREDPETHVLSGTVRGSGGATEIARRLFKSEVAGGSVRLLTEEKFNDLWSRLEAAGLFRLPPFPGKEAPKDESYFLLRSGKDKWIFTRPIVKTLAPSDPGIELFQYWKEAKRVMVEFINER